MSPWGEGYQEGDRVWAFAVVSSGEPPAGDGGAHVLHSSGAHPAQIGRCAEAHPTLLLERLMEEGRKLGVDKVVASISSRNDESLAFHRKQGFVECGRLKTVGRKFGEEFDVVWMQREI